VFAGKALVSAHAHNQPSGAQINRFALSCSNVVVIKLHFNACCTSVCTCVCVTNISCLNYAIFIEISSIVCCQAMRLFLVPNCRCPKPSFGSYPAPAPAPFIVYIIQPIACFCLVFLPRLQGCGKWSLDKGRCRANNATCHSCLSQGTLSRTLLSQASDLLGRSTGGRGGGAAWAGAGGDAGALGIRRPLSRGTRF